MKVKIDRDKNELFIQKQIDSFDSFKGIICFCNNLNESIENADIIIECINENFKDKCELLKEIDKKVSHKTLVATHTINFNINDLVAHVKTFKNRFIGVRFLYPVYFMPEVEVRLSEFFRLEYIESLRKILESIDKKIVFHSGHEIYKLTAQEIELRKQQRREYLEREKNIKLQEEPEKLLGAKELTKKMDQCSVCMDKLKNCVIRPCNHLSTCFDCAKLLKQNNGYCPICRSFINEIIKVYIS